MLYKTAMPSVLIETGFLTNRTEEKYLLTEKAKMLLLQVYSGLFMNYKLDMETPRLNSSGGAENDLNKIWFK